MKNLNDILEIDCIKFLNSILNNKFTDAYIEKIENEYTLFEMTEYIDEIMDALENEEEEKNKIEKIWITLLSKLNKENSLKELEDIVHDKNTSINNNYLNEKSICEDSLRQYLNEVGQYPVLTAEEEMKYTNHYNIYHDDESRKIIINHNLRLVICIAKKFHFKGVSLLDLIQAGNMGLIKGVEKFDPQKGYRFSTYATWWIMQTVKRWIVDNTRTIKLPAYRVEEMNKLIILARNWFQANAEEITDEEIMENLNWNIEKVKEIKKMIQNQHTTSLSSPVNEDKDAELGDLIEDEEIETESIAFKSLQKDAIEKVIKTLLPREQEVIILRFGLEDGIPMTLESIGKKFNVTRERIRQIESKAIRKLRHSSRSKYLKDFL